MKQIIPSLLVAILVLGSVGCNLCCSPYDYDYPTYGGIHERVNPSYGRVGSIYSDPNAVAIGPSADSNLDSLGEGRTDSNDRFDDSDLESISPRRDGKGGDPSRLEQELPPPTESAADPTASRLMGYRPLR